MSEPLKSSNGALWVQTTPGQAPEYLGCVDLDPISEPLGDVTLLQCRDVNGNYVTKSKSRGAPGAATTSLSTWVYPDADIIDRIKNCPVNIFALSRDCGRADVFNNYVRGKILSNAVVTTRSIENIVKREGDDAVLKKLDFSADNPVFDVRKVVVNRLTIAETTALQDVAFCNVPQCAGACGAQSEIGESGLTAGNSSAGSPTIRADIWSTVNSGALWTNIAGGAAHPFAAGEDVLSIVCFQVDRNTTRWLVARESVVGQPAKIAYSDNGGVSWTLVTVGSTNNEGAAWNGALFQIDSQHIWLATSAGNVYFSSDGGLTWTNQGALTASGGKSLNGIKFSDTNNGYAVGDTGTIIHTSDGGDTWSLITDPSGGDDILSLHPFTQFRAIIGTDKGEIWQTWNEGDNWTAKGYTGQAATDAINDMSFINDLVGFMVQNTSAPLGYVHRSKDGGHTWERLDTPLNAGLNAVWVGDENLAYVVGNAQGGTSVILKVSG